MLLINHSITEDAYTFEKWESLRMKGEAEKLKVKDTFKGLKQKIYVASEKTWRQLKYALHLSQALVVD